MTVVARKLIGITTFFCWRNKKNEIRLRTQKVSSKIVTASRFVGTIGTVAIAVTHPCNGNTFAVRAFACEFVRRTNVFFCFVCIQRWAIMLRIATQISNEKKKRKRELKWAKFLSSQWLRKKDQKRRPRTKMLLPKIHQSKVTYYTYRDLHPNHPSNHFHDRTSIVSKCTGRFYI